MLKTDVVIIGAGAAGLMCAIEAGLRHRKVVVLDHANKVGKKILISGGGRCNFTNYHISPESYISNNPHFCKSALSRYTQWDFIARVTAHKIPFHEKTLGQLFCDHKSKEILEMLLRECDQVGAKIQINTRVDKVIKKNDNHYIIHSSNGTFSCESLVIATGGLSFPTMGASPFGYKIAEQFEIKTWPTRAGLVPLTLHTEDKEKLSSLSGIAVPCIASTHQKSFRENLLFTHRGLSGPCILQISSYWQAGEKLQLNLLPDINLVEYLELQKQQHPRKQLNSILTEILPKRVVQIFLAIHIAAKTLQELSNQELKDIAEHFNNWLIRPNGTEGYRTAEVTLGGVDCDTLSSKTMETIAHKGLYFIGEVLDVTGWLGGYNFQWAWSSGWAAGQYV